VWCGSVPVVVHYGSRRGWGKGWGISFVVVPVGSAPQAAVGRVCAGGGQRLGQPVQGCPALSMPCAHGAQRCPQHRAPERRLRSSIEVCGR
jgi:hypothetical protein